MNITYVTKENMGTMIAELRSRGKGAYREQEKTVRKVIEDVKTEGDAALFRYTEQWDGIRLTPETLYVSDEEIEEAYGKCPEGLPVVIRKAIDKIRSYHEKQKRVSYIDADERGIILGGRFTAMDRVGVYVPGGKAAYPSSVLMNIIPARVAGVGEIIMTTPCAKDGSVDPGVLVAAKEAGINRICKAGGAQAVAALAYGTESVPKVDKIVGPGNIYVALAKKEVFGDVSIDSVAGPSEILVLADDSADAKYVAADMLSQAEHDEMASAVLVCTDAALAAAVSDEIEYMAGRLTRRDIIKASLDNYGRLLVAEDIQSAAELVNAFAPEHLEIQTRDAWNVMTMIRHAGAIFIGPYSSEPLGDYFAGPNHVLPTGGTARFFSPLCVDDFIKRSSIISYSKEALEAVHEDIELFAKCEELTAHANSIAVRFGDGLV